MGARVSEGRRRACLRALVALRFMSFHVFVSVQYLD
jgi:hypothetical protein